MTHRIPEIIRSSAASAFATSTNPCRGSSGVIAHHKPRRMTSDPGPAAGGRCETDCQDMVIWLWRCGQLPIAAVLRAAPRLWDPHERFMSVDYSSAYAEPGKGGQRVSFGSQILVL